MLKLKSINFNQQAFSEYELNQKHPKQLEWVIGRSESCDLVLNSPEISKVHGRIQVNGEEYSFIDLGSRNGSYINGKEVQPNQRQSLQLGDLLQLGETYLHVEALTLPTAPGAMAQPHLQNAATWNSEELIIRCCRIIQETRDIKTFCFVAEPPVLFNNYLPGQFINLAVEIDGQQLTRPYSISSSPTRPHSLWLTIKRMSNNDPDVPRGIVSNWLHDQLRVGDRLKILGGPVGNFTFLPNAPQKLLLISAGSGITPLMSMVRWAHDTFFDSSIIFLHSARAPEDIAFRSELEMMSAQMPTFQPIITVTQQKQELFWLGHRGRISKVLLQAVVTDLQERIVFVCGPKKFMASIRAALEELSFPMEHYCEESFGNGQETVIPAPIKETISAKIVLPEKTDSFSTDHTKSDTQLSTITNNRNGKALDSVSVVTFAHSQHTTTAESNCSILEVAEQAGVSIPSSCRLGACGTCKLLKHEGQVAYVQPPTALTRADQEGGYVLACTAIPVGHVVVEA